MVTLDRSLLQEYDRNVGKALSHHRDRQAHILLIGVHNLIRWCSSWQRRNAYLPTICTTTTSMIPPGQPGLPRQTDFFSRDSAVQLQLYVQAKTHSYSKISREKGKRSCFQIHRVCFSTTPSRMDASARCCLAAFDNCKILQACGRGSGAALYAAHT